MNKSISQAQNWQCEGDSNGLFGGRTSFGAYSTGNAPNDALLTVFQAEPLVYVDSKGTHPVPFLDFELERNLLVESLCLTEGIIGIDLKFDFATTERFRRFLVKAEGTMLHFSCHGHPDYLAIENGWGVMQTLPDEQLRDWIQAGGESLKFVFVSACHSRSAADAFLKAGVKHVVCCQRDDQTILNTSSIIFTRALYQALSNGRSLSQAFTLARQEVLNSPHLPRGQGAEEATKFALLPEQNVDHNVAIFQPTIYATLSLTPSSSSLSISPKSRVLPLPPQIFVGRQMDTWKILDALKLVRVVRVTGALGVGKGSAVSKVCQYIQDRQVSCMQKIGEILWLPSLLEEKEDQFSEFSQLFGSDNYKCPRHLLAQLSDSNALLVIDVRKAQSPQSFINIASFIHDVVHQTRDTRVIVIHHLATNSNKVQSLPFKEIDVLLRPLDFVTSVHLFGKLCQHVTDRRYENVSNSFELYAILVPKDNPSEEPHTRRRLEIFKMIGEGIPAQIHQAAKHMTGIEYDRMIALGLRKDQVLNFTSRAALEKEFSEQMLKLECARKEKRWEDATLSHDLLQEMELLREKLHDLPTLRSLAQSLRANLVAASNARDMPTCVKLQGELNVIEEKIKIEISAMRELGEQAEDESEQEEETLSSDTVNQKKYETRAELDVQIMNLQRQLEIALEGNHFDKARNIDGQIEILRERCSNLPTRDDLVLRIATLQGAMKQAKVARSIDLAESLYTELNETMAFLAAENEAHALLQGEEDHGNSLLELHTEKYEASEISSLRSNNGYARRPFTTTAALVPSSETEAPAHIQSRQSLPRSTSSRQVEIESRPTVPGAFATGVWNGERFARQHSGRSFAQRFRSPSSQPSAAAPLVASLPTSADDDDWEHPSQVSVRPPSSTMRLAQQNYAAEVYNDATSEVSVETEYTTTPQIPEARMVDSGVDFDNLRHERLILERMIQESISNMAVAAIEVERVEGGSERRQGRTLGKPIRNLFGMRKQKSKF